MDLYKLKSFMLIGILYLIAILPCFIIFNIKKNINSKKTFIKYLCISTLIEIIIFSIIYAFPRNIIKVFSVPQNIENYSVYALKILFIASIFTPIHYAFPITLLKSQKKKKAVILFSLKLIYIPILIFVNFVFSTKLALFSMPILDILYSIFLLFIFYKT